jgi:hypothetical protein
MSNAITRKLSPSKIGLAVAAPLAAAVFSILISSLAVIASKKSPIEAFKTMWDYGTESGSLMEIVNTATPYYIAAIAIAVTFRAGYLISVSKVNCVWVRCLAVTSARCLCCRRYCMLPQSLLSQ